MKKLGTMVLALVGLAQSGCILVADGDEAQFGYSWTVTANGAASSCDAVKVSAGGVFTSFVSTLADTGMGYDDLYNCSDLAGTSNKLPLGDYTIAASLNDDTGTPNDFTDDTLLAAGGTITSSLLIADELLVLPTVAFDVAVAPVAHTVTFGVDYGVAGGSNCTSTTAGGSGVAQTEVRLYETGSGTCLAGQYACLDAADQPVNCDLCGKVICQENTATLAFAIGDGSYEIETIGYKGAAAGTEVYACYMMAAPQAFTVAGADLDLGQLVAGFDDSLFPTECNATKPVR